MKINQAKSEKMTTKNYHKNWESSPIFPSSVTELEPAKITFPTRQCLAP
ncbi:hypothetical protein CCACVL1_19462, partial [Corchorus capsularis]